MNCTLYFKILFKFKQKNNKTESDYRRQSSWVPNKKNLIKMNT